MPSMPYDIYRTVRTPHGAVRTTLVQGNIATLEEADDLAKMLTFTKYSEHIAILKGGLAEPVIQQNARWTRIMELTDNQDDAGCDWITIGDMTCIAEIDWIVSWNPEVAQLVRECNRYIYGEGAKDLTYTDEEDYYQRNPEQAKAKQA